MNYIFVLFYSILCAYGIVSSDTELTHSEIRDLSLENKNVIIDHNSAYADIYSDSEWH